jgi:hypothetical protein
MPQFQRKSNRSQLNIDPNNKLGEGGEATVYRTNITNTFGQDLAAKIYKNPPPKTTVDKLEIMYTLGCPVRVGRAGITRVPFAWPEDLLLDTNGAVSGYLMRFASGSVSLYEFLLKPNERNRIWPNIHWGELLSIARNVAEVFSALHKTSRYVVGDVKDENIMLDVSGEDKGTVTLIDIDSIQVTNDATKRVLFCNVVSPAFKPPEMMRTNTTQPTIEPFSDLFGMTVLIFKLLSWTGVHPFQGGGSIDDSVKQGDYCLERTSLVRGFMPRPDLLFGSEILGLFRRCFVDGDHDPAKRPSADDWVQALDRAKNNLKKCSADSREVYLSTVSSCPFCDSYFLRQSGQTHVKNIWNPPNPSKFNFGNFGGGKTLPPINSTSGASSGGQVQRGMPPSGVSTGGQVQRGMPPSGVSAGGQTQRGTSPSSTIQQRLSQWKKNLCDFLVTQYGNITSMFSKSAYRPQSKRKFGLWGFGVGLVFTFFALNLIYDNYRSLGFLQNNFLITIKEPLIGETPSPPPPPPPPQNKLEQAKRLESLGDYENRLGHFSKAYNYYKQAYDLIPSSSLRKKMGDAKALASL